MTDELFPGPTKVRFPCAHGQWFRHPTDVRSPGPFQWCDGGETRWLIQAYGESMPKTWVEVTE